MKPRNQRNPGRALAALALIVLLAGCGSDRTVYVGGPIVTMDAGGNVAQALGIEGERVAIVGSESSVRTWAGSGARVVDLKGRALLPGFIDAHGHFPGAGLYAVMANLNSPPIGPVERIDQVVELLRQQAAEKSSGEWVVGMNYDDTLLEEKRHPTRQDLDRVSTEHPVVAVHISGHLAAVNSRALEEMGVDASTPDPEGGLFRREADGSPNGVLEENAMEEFAGTVLSPGPMDALTIIREASRLYAEAGVTTAQNGWATTEQMTALDWLSWLGVIPIRMVLWPGDVVADQMLAGEVEFAGHDPDWVRLGAVKIVADGSIQGYTGYLKRPYHRPPGDDPNYRGYPRVPREELIEKVKRYHEAGMQIAVHGNGDASIDDILDAYEQAFEAKPAKDARPIVIHAQMTRDDQLDRMKKLSVVPSFFSLHTYYWGDRHWDIFMGPARARRMSPAASALRKGVRFTIHCDTPVVPMEPLRLVWAAVNRISSGGRTIGEAERITAEQALRAVTIDAAWQHFEEDVKGSLERGKFADLVILSENPLAVPAEQIASIQVLETIVAGKTVYARDVP